MLLNMKDMLGIARKNCFAVGAFNISDSLLFETVMEAAEENDAPVIVQLVPEEVEFVGEDFFKYVLSRIKRSSVPVVLHLDHGQSLEDCQKAIDYGFTSVMIDGSLLPYAENVRISKKVVEMCHVHQVSVEAELGTIGVLENSFEGGTKNIEYTRPESVEDFLKKTGCDSLAIAIGTAHGIYPENRVPELRLDILEKINEITTRPLVLHGGSSNKDEEIKKACQSGISKVNIASDYQKAFFNALEEVLTTKHPYWTPEVYPDAVREAKKVVTHKMGLFGSIDKKHLYSV